MGTIGRIYKKNVKRGCMMEINVERLRKIVIETIDMTREPGEDELHQIIDKIIKENVEYKYISVNERCRIHKEIYASIKGLDVIEELISNQEITEIMINGINSIYIEKQGQIKKVKECFISEERLNDVIQQIVAKTNKRVNESNPIVDTRLEDGSRVNIVLSPISIDGAAVTIRKFPKENITMDNLIEWKSITEEAAEFMKILVMSGYNIFISGGTGSGKTTFLNVLSGFIPSDERVITIEDSAELQLKSVNNIIRMETRPATCEGTNEISIRDLIKTSLRMRPDRIIVGEVRGGETLDMLQAMNTGHDGSMSTGHANSPEDMLSRLETMVLISVDMPLAAIRAQIASAIDIIVHLGRLRDRSRKILEIDEVVGMVSGNIMLRPLYLFKEEDEKDGEVVGRLIKTRNTLSNTSKMIARGMEG